MLPPMKFAAVLLSVFFALPLGAAPEYPAMGADLYDTKADGNTQVATALKQALAEHKRVLVMFGANWCPWCRRLHHTLATDPAVAKALRENYELVLIDANTRHDPKRNAAVIERYDNPPQHGLPVFVVLATDGKQLTTRETADLEDEKGQHVAERVLAFLVEWKLKNE